MNLKVRYRNAKAGKWKGQNRIGETKAEIEKQR